jgi:hypothetical protein
VREPLKIGPLSISYFLAFQDILPLSSFLPWVLFSLPYVWTSLSYKMYSYTLRKTAGSC